MRPPDSMTSIWRSISYSRAARTKRKLFTFLTSTLAPKRSAPSDRKRFLTDAAAGLNDFDLAFDLILESSADKAEAVYVFDFDLSAEALRAFKTDTYIRVTSERAFFHVAVGDLGVEQNFFQTREVLEGFIGRADVGFADDLGERRAAAVQVEIGARGGVGKAVVEAFAGVFFHVQAGNADALHGAVCCGHVDPAVLCDGLVELRYLVALGQVGVEVVFAREDGALAHLAVEGERSQRGKLDGLGVEHRQCAGKAEADRADVGVWRGAEVIGAAAEGLGGGEQLHVDFESDDGLVLGQDFRGQTGSGRHI